MLYPPPIGNGFKIQNSTSKIENVRSCPIQTVLDCNLQVTDILDRIISEVGPSRIWQSTFSISEEFLRRLHVMQRVGQVKEATVVLDHKACRKIVHLWPFISNVYEKSYLADNHSKILLIRSDAGDRVAVVTSQNLTRGGRYESTVIMSMPEIFESLLEQFESLTTYHAVPLNDLLGKRPRSD